MANESCDTVVNEPSNNISINHITSAICFKEYQSTLSSTISRARNYLNYLPKEDEQTYGPSDESSQYASISNNDQKYRIHVGTRPENYSKGDGRTYQQSQPQHMKIISALENFLTWSDIIYEVLKADAFSRSHTWGLESYACIEVSCSRTTALGYAALIGYALKQAAIGIFNNDMNDDVHDFFIVLSSSGSSISNDQALELMLNVTDQYQSLTAQFDAKGQAIEFHNFDGNNLQEIPVDDLSTIINNYSEKDLLQVKKSTGKSSLLEKKDYEEAINKAGLQQQRCLIDLVRLDDKLFNASESTEQSTRY
jgi:hypothetical protein